MKTRKYNMLWKVVIGISLTIFTVCMALLILFELHSIDPLIPAPLRSLFSTEDNNSGRAGSYAVETCYTGDPYLSDVLFEIPFQRTDRYVCNNDVLQEIGADNAEILTNKAQTAVSLLFDSAYQERDTSDEALTELLDDSISVVFSDGTITDGAADTVEKINTWFSDTHTSMEGELTTDKCMVFYDEGMLIVRGEFVFAVYSSDDFDTFKSNFGMKDLSIGTRKSCVMELEFLSPVNRADYNSYKLCGIKIPQ